MDLVKHIERGRINPIRIKNTFDIWMKRIASLKDSSLEVFLIKIVTCFSFSF